MATLRNAYECLQESVAQRERNEEVEKAAMQEELEQLRATCAKQANHMVSIISICWMIIIFSYAHLVLSVCLHCICILYLFVYKFLWFVCLSVFFIFEHMMAITNLYNCLLMSKLLSACLPEIVELVTCL